MKYAKKGAEMEQEKHYSYGRIEINYQVKPSVSRQDLYSAEQYMSGYIANWDKGPFSPENIEQLKRHIEREVMAEPRLHPTVKAGAMSVLILAWQSFQVWQEDENGNRILVKNRPSEHLLDVSFIIPKKEGI